ncbi:MAG: hypothetical protein PHX62_02085 [Bacilli bacterium]|nr:hypothetical protein [Bacilli bacterium]
MVEIGNLYYFLYWIFGIGMYSLFYFILRNKTKKTQYLVLLIILFANLVLHFCKLLFEPYRSGLPATIRKVTFENICAVTTLVIPWVFLYKKNKSLNNYILFISTIGGLAALIFPTEALGESPYAFDTIRFYLCHMILLIVPLLTITLNLYRPDIKKFWSIPIIFILFEYIILINELLLIKIGWVETNLASFLSREGRNNAFIFGPTSEFDSFSKIFTVFTPNIFTKDVFNINNGVDFYWPVIWLIIPAFIYFSIIYILFCIPFNNRRKKNERN